MTPSVPLFNVSDDCEAVIARLTRHLADSGFQVVRSFDFQRARAVHPGCTCPHHGMAECDCQMIVLLIYLTADRPVSLVAHGHDGATYLSWGEECPQAEELTRTIQDAFSPTLRS